MPYDVRKRGNQWCVFKKGTDKSFGCHNTEEGAHRQRRAILANEKKAELEVRLLKKHAKAA